MMEDRKDHADVKIPPPVLASLHILAAFVLNRIFPLHLPFAYILLFVGWLFVLLGLVLAFAGVRELMKARTSIDPHGSVFTIVTSGPYRFTRNPIYLGFVCMLIGFPMSFGTWWGVILAPVFILLMNTLVIQHEEAYLEKKFGDEYTSFKSRVRRWL
jgi:protein-S-isoprenylcysteine O-methyltransferase Ste14